MVTSPVPVDPFLLLMLHAMSSRFYKRGWDEERVATVRPGHCVFTRGVCVCVCVFGVLHRERQRRGGAVIFRLT